MYIANETIIIIAFLIFFDFESLLIDFKIKVVTIVRNAPIVIRTDIIAFGIKISWQI